MDLRTQPHVPVLATESCEQALLLPCWAALSGLVNTCMVLAAASCKHRFTSKTGDCQEMFARREVSTW